MDDHPLPPTGETMIDASDHTPPDHAATGAEPASASVHDAAGTETGHETAEQLMQEAGERIRALEATVEEMREKWMRAEAENQNVRSRAKRDVDDARQYAVTKFAKDVVEAAENLRRGLTSLPADTGDNPVLTRLREGFEGVERSFLGILERNGIVGADPTGAAFDANLHQAMAEQPSAEHPPGTVIQAWTSAWTLNGRLLKPAMVVVAKAAEQPAQGQTPHGQTPNAQPAPSAESEPASFDRTV